MTNKRLSFSTHPTYYGNGNMTEAFETGEIGFELELAEDTKKIRFIITHQEALELKSMIEKSLLSYDEFKESYVKTATAQ